MSISRTVLSIVFVLCVGVANVWAGETFGDFSSGSGSQQLNWSEEFNYADGGQTKVDTRHSTDSSGRSIETQTTSYTGPDGKTYTETQTSEYDPYTGKTSTTDSSTGTPPTHIDDTPAIDKGGVDVTGKTDTQSIDTQYRDGGVTDTFTDTKTGKVDTWQSVDMDSGKTSSGTPARKEARQWQGPPARTLPIICRVSSLFTKTSASEGKAQELMSQVMANQGKDTQQVVKDWMKNNKEFLATGPRSMRMEKINWTMPLIIAGYPTEQYRVIVEDRPVADFWIAPKINIWKVLEGNRPARATRIGQMILPHWKKVSEVEQKRVFKHLVLAFKDISGKGYVATSIKTSADSHYNLPAIPDDYKLEVINLKAVQDQLNQMMR